MASDGVDRQRGEGLPFIYVIVAHMASGGIGQNAEDRQAVSVPLEHPLLLRTPQPVFCLYGKTSTRRCISDLYLLPRSFSISFPDSEAIRPGLSQATRMLLACI